MVTKEKYHSNLENKMKKNLVVKFEHSSLHFLDVHFITF